MTGTIREHKLGQTPTTDEVTMKVKELIALLHSRSGGPRSQI